MNYCQSTHEVNFPISHFKQVSAFDKRNSWENDGKVSLAHLASNDSFVDAQLSPHSCMSQRQIKVKCRSWKLARNLRFIIILHNQIRIIINVKKIKNKLAITISNDAVQCRIFVWFRYASEQWGSHNWSFRFINIGSLLGIQQKKYWSVSEQWRTQLSMCLMCRVFNHDCTILTI